MAGLVQPVDQILDNFCHLIIEDFLTRKQMKDTLQSFRTEWNRPTEELVMFSWYELALRLRLPELIEQNRKEDAVLPNLVSALIQESSIRNRRPPEVTISGLAMQPRPVALPTLAPPPDTHERTVKGTEQVSRPPPIKINFEQEFKQRKDSQAANNPAPKLVMKNHFKHAPKTSNENWIPEEIRMKSLQRDIMHAKETLEDSMKLESSLAREMRRLTVSDLERAKAEGE
ncbi:hypothetical protein EON65_55035 [archaeon]|nr:MAG: hypothetical protein EON65_55035 [archaeon]